MSVIVTVKERFVSVIKCTYSYVAYELDVGCVRWWCLQLVCCVAQW